MFFYFSSLEVDQFKHFANHSINILQVSEFRITHLQFAIHILIIITIIKMMDKRIPLNILQKLRMSPISENSVEGGQSSDGEVSNQIRID